jgi:hypothetical protein
MTGRARSFGCRKEAKSIMQHWSPAHKVSAFVDDGEWVPSWDEFRAEHDPGALAVDPNVSFTAVHASRGKVIRAEPVAALYEQRKVHHVGTLAGARRSAVHVYVGL